MTNQNQTRAANSYALHSLPLLLILFAGSGCSALIYEVVWYQLLQLAIGSTAVSLGVLLATFMGGLCLGSIGLPRIRSLRQHPLRIYALLELGIALCGILVLLGIPYIDRLYIAGAEHGLPNMLLRGLVSAVCLLPPTVFMGASLPAVVQGIEARPRGLSWWGWLYSGNTAGAVFGSLFASFYLLRLYNMATATYVAVAINMAVAAISFGLAARTPVETKGSAAAEVPFAAVPAQADAGDGSRWTIYVTIALSGVCSLGAEVVWTRLMGMMLGATVYAFSIILGVFLLGLAIGSAGAAWLLPRVRPRLALGWCQALLAAGIAWAAFMINNSLPFRHIDPFQSTSPWYTFLLHLTICLWTILPPTILWGASFPFALAAVASPGDDPGRLFGNIYAANTLGAIVGALAVSLALIPWIGTQQSQRLLLLLSAAGACLVLVPYAREYRSKTVLACLTASLAFAGLLAWSLGPIPGNLIAFGRTMATLAGDSKILYTAEGRNSSAAYLQLSDGTIEIGVNGHIEASTEPYDMKLQRMVGHLPALLHPNPQSVLGIGFGAGVSAGTFTRYPSIREITICEIEPVIPPASTRFFTRENYDVMDNPRTRIIYDDARHFVLTTPKMFDIIASDPLDVFVKGTAALYSKEYFEAVKDHLNPGGTFTLYVPLYESDEKTVKSELATFLEVFPYGTVWGNTMDGQGYDMVLMGQAGPLKINLDEIQQRLERPDYGQVADSLHEIGINSATDLFSSYAGQKSDLASWLQGAEINRDGDLRLQYLAGWGIDSSLADQIYHKILSYRRPPGNLFDGSPQQIQSLLLALPSVPSN